MPAGPVAAHAEPVGISPAPGTSLAEQPSRVVARFDDELDAEASVIELVDEQGEVVARGGVALDVLDHRTMRLSVPADLADGAYAIRWQVVGITDGHTVPGETGFAVGAADPAAALSDDTVVADDNSPGGTGDQIAVIPWLVAFLVAVVFLLVVIFHRGRRGGTSPKEQHTASRVP
jgi:methionine-rich copper-binding protein CopC